MLRKGIHEIEDEFIKLLEVTELRRRKYLHPKSVENFLKHFNSLSEKNKIIVSDMLNDYLEQLKYHLAFFEKTDSILFFNNYVLTIGNIFEEELSFKKMIDWSFIFFWGIFFDLSFFLTGLAKLYFNLPLVLIVLIIRKVYYLKLELGCKMYGLFY